MADNSDTKPPARRSDDGHHQSSHTSDVFEEQSTSKEREADED
jgi:hypothetical protein